MNETKAKAKCAAAANLKGEHIPCNEKPGHTGWAHGNAEHGLIWDGPDMGLSSRAGKS